MLPPFNIELLIPTAKDLVNVPRVEVLDIFAGGTKNYAATGLFSQENFGRPGEEKRSRLYGYIDLKIKIMHPLIYSMLINMKSLYEGIMKGTEYAVFDEKIKDFVKSDPIDGKTGYDYFASNFAKINFDGRGSDKREMSIKVLDKYKDVILFDKLIVMPPGLRDYSVDENGKPSEDDINKLYRKVLGTANMVSSVNKSANPEHLDSMRISMQLGVVEIYNYIMDMLDGKNKFMMGKFTTRKIYRSTRNVITAYSPRHNNLLSPRRVSVNQTGVGLQQYVTACVAQIGKVIRDDILGDVFTGPNTPSSLIDKTTFKKQLVRGTEDSYDKWMTLTGLEKVVEAFSIEELKHDFIIINGFYAALIYKGPDNTFKLLYDIDDLPEGLDKKYVTPLTYAELFYIAAYKMANNTPCTITRYPISGYGSVYPSMSYLISTNVSELRYKLDDSWTKTDEVAPEFPIYQESFFNSLCLSPPHLTRAGADHDGDTVNWIPVFTDEAIAEVVALLASAKYYVGFDGSMFFSAADDISSLVVAHMFN